MRTRAARRGHIEIHRERSVVTDTESTLPTNSKPQSLLRRRWPTLAGLGLAALIAVDLMSGVELAPVLAASAAVYLGAAALQRPAAAWPLFFATAAVITIARLLEDRFEPTWVRKCVMQLVGAHEALHQGGPVGARGLAQPRSLGWMPRRSRRLSKDPEGSTG